MLLLYQSPPAVPLETASGPARHSDPAAAILQIYLCLCPCPRPTPAIPSGPPCRHSLPGPVQPEPSDTSCNRNGTRTTAVAPPQILDQVWQQDPAGQSVPADWLLQTLITLTPGSICTGSICPGNACHPPLTRGKNLSKRSHQRAPVCRSARFRPSPARGYLQYSRKL